MRCQHKDLAIARRSHVQEQLQHQTPSDAKHILLLFAQRVAQHDAAGPGNLKCMMWFECTPDLDNDVTQTENATEQPWL